LGSGRGAMVDSLGAKTILSDSESKLAAHYPGGSHQPETER
jgi:hypothetical protein